MKLPRCRECSRRIYPWQSTVSAGPLHHRRRDADLISHFGCAPEETPAPARTTPEQPPYRTFHPNPRPREEQD